MNEASEPRRSESALKSNCAHIVLMELLNMVHQEDITLMYRTPSNDQHQVYGLYMKVCGEPIISLSESLMFNPSKHLEVLAHELGHHFSDCHSNVLKSNTIDILRDEIKAWKWAAEYLCNALASMDDERSFEHEIASSVAI